MHRGKRLVFLTKCGRLSSEQIQQTLSIVKCKKFQKDLKLNINFLQAAAVVLQEEGAADGLGEVS